MTTLRNLSARPELLVSDHTAPVTDPTGGGIVGFAGPLTNHRWTQCLPLNKYAGGPFLLKPPFVVADDRGHVLVDPTDNSVLGTSNAFWIHRLLTAAVTDDTRRL